MSEMRTGFGGLNNDVGGYPLSHFDRMLRNKGLSDVLG